MHNHQVINEQYERLSNDLAETTKRGLPMILTGIVFWLISGISGFLLEEIVEWVYIFGIGVIFPAGLIVGKLMNIDMLASHNPLSKLAGAAGGMQILFAPLVILILNENPQWLPLAIAVLTGAHFMPFSVIFRSKAYIFLSVFTVGAGSICGYFFIDHSFRLTPFVVAFGYALTCVFLHYENRKAAVVHKPSVS